MLWFDQPANGIGYFSAHLPVDTLPEELLPYLPLFCALLVITSYSIHYTKLYEMS